MGTRVTGGGVEPEPRKAVWPNAVWVVRCGEGGDKASEGFDLFEAAKCAAIGWHEIGDLSPFRGRGALKAKFKATFPGSKAKRVDTIAGIILSFLNGISVGDLILTPSTEKNADDVLIGRCLGEYQYAPGLVSENYPNVRRVEWLRKVDKSEFSDAVIEKLNLPGTVRNAGDNTREILDILGQGVPLNTAKPWDQIVGWDEFEGWDEFVGLARQYLATGQLEIDEIEYKVEIGRKLAAAREAVRTGANDWIDLVKAGLRNNLIVWRNLAKLRDWVTKSPDDALRALQAIWMDDGPSVAERVRNFSDLLPRSVVSGVGSRTTVASVFLMGLDVRHYPPFRIGLFNEAYERAGYSQPRAGEDQKTADEATLYEHALGFLDRFLEDASQRGLTLRHRLDAQSVVWAILQDYADPNDPWAPANIEKLANEFLWETHDLQKIIVGLQDKRQAIFQGPPGTGKTFVAKRIAEWCKEHGGDFRIVQFHPSYAYEDFVEGFRPRLTEGGQAGFVLTNGPLRNIAEKAKNNPDATFILVIDEINRGNVAKVLGELYFLLEYRDEEVSLQYSSQDFSLPQNLWFIGTMNTTDRSIALVDSALRRRFYFFNFFPDQPPVKGLLERWLEENDPDGIWVADLVDRANAKLKDRHLGIGPSHFMKKDPPLDEERVRFIWEQAVIPYIEEQSFGDEDRLEEFAYDRLMGELGVETDSPNSVSSEPKGAAVEEAGQTENGAGDATA